jgi:hypothetical protein
MKLTCSVAGAALAAVMVALAPATQAQPTALRGCTAAPLPQTHRSAWATVEHAPCVSRKASAAFAYLT